MNEVPQLQRLMLSRLLTPDRTCELNMLLLALISLLYKYGLYGTTLLCL